MPSQYNLLVLLSYLYEPIPLGKIIRICNLLGIAEGYSSDESFRVSIISALNQLHKKHLIEIEGDYGRKYKISDLGLRAIATEKIDRLLWNNIVMKVI